MGDSVMAEDKVYGDEQEARTGYEYDRQFKGYVIPSHKGQMGGSMGFDPNNPDIKQNIIACEDNNMVKVAETTASKLSAMAGDVAKMSEDERVEHFKTIHALEKAKEQAVKAEAEQPLKEAPIPTAPMPMVMPKIDLTPPEEERQVLPPTGEVVKEVKIPNPVYVKIKGPFGKIRQPFTSVFRDGIHLVLSADHTVHPIAYDLPELDEGEVMELTVEVGQLVLQCIWAGISFTMPDGSVTFNVLLIQEETQVE